MIPEERILYHRELLIAVAESKACEYIAHREYGMEEHVAANIFDAYSSAYQKGFRDAQRVLTRRVKQAVGIDGA